MKVWTKSLIVLTLTAGPLFSISASAAPPAVVSTSTPAQDALIDLSVRAGSPLPAGTRLLSINLAKGLATVDFSREFQSNFSGGDTQSFRTISAVLRTLGRFPTIDRVQILVDGNPLDTYGGMLSLTDPLPVIRPAAIPSQPAIWMHRKSPAKAGAKT